MRVSTSVSSPEVCAVRLPVSFLLRKAKQYRVLYLSKSHDIFSFRRLLEQNLCPDILLKSSQISVEGFSKRQISHTQGHCSEARQVGLSRIDLLAFCKLISSVFDGVSGQKTGAQLIFECDEVELFGGSTCLGLSSPLESIVSKRVAAKATLNVGFFRSGTTAKKQYNARNQS